MKRLFYPAVFQAEEEGKFTVYFPDVDGAITYGHDMGHAYEMAIDALGLVLSYMEDNGETLPEPSSPQKIALNPGQFLVVIEFDMLAYKKKHSAKAVKKTLTIPEWLNEEAVSMNINFSQVLQDALIQKINN